MSARLGAVISLIAAALALTGCVDSPIGGEKNPCAGVVGLSCIPMIAAVEPDQTHLSFTNGTGSSLTRTFTMTNHGTIEDTLTAFSIEGPDGEPFLARLSDIGTPRDRAELDVVLEPGQSQAFEVTYAGTGFGVDQAQLVVRTERSGEWVIGLGTTDVEIRLDFTTAFVDFGTVAAGDMVEVPLELRNVGDRDAHLMTATTTGSPDFDVTGPVPLTLPPGESTSFVASYRPATDSRDAGAVVVTYTWGDDEGREYVIEAAMAGNNEPVFPSCLEAIAVARPLTDGQGSPLEPVPEPAATIEVEAGARVQLDGTRSFDPDGDAVATFSWRIKQIPQDFSIDFSDRSAATPEVQLSQAGTYVFELDVFDAGDEASCSPGRVEIEVVR